MRMPRTTGTATIDGKDGEVHRTFPFFLDFLLNLPELWGIIFPSIFALSRVDTEDIIMIEITKDTIIGEVLDIAPQTAPIFLSIGMHCLGCMASRGETVEEACMVHDQPVEELVERLNDIIKANRKN